MFRLLALKFYNFLFPTDAGTTFATENDMSNYARLIQVESGRFALVNGNGLIKTYARARDARRGATRLGLVVA